MEGRNTTAARLETGRIKVHPDGFGFVAAEGGGEEIFIAARGRGGAMDGDRVSVDWWVGPRGLEGRIAAVLERARKKVTGTISGSGRKLRFTPDDPRVSTAIELIGGPGGAREGESVIATIERYPEAPEEAMAVKVLKVLGDPDDPRTEVEKALAVADVDEEFPPEVARMAAQMPPEVTEGDRRDRTDLRHVPFTTIDPETARDFDDAVALEDLPGGGVRLWVAVADVSHYVRPGTPLDTEAHKRGCSIYLPDRAIPMLPEPLSAHLCSLVPEQDRLAMVVRIDHDRAGAVTGVEFYAGIIHSRGRLDYPGVAAALAGDLRGPRKKYEPFLPALRALDAFSHVLRARRFARGALDLDLPEVKVALDEDDPRRIRDVLRARKDPGERRAYAMIEECMLAANEAVARSFGERGEDTVYRVHAAPDETKMEAFAELAGRYGIRVDVDEARTPQGLQRVLKSLEGHSAQKPLSFQLLRSLKQATYDVRNVGHFGLASHDYLHFTSPIRRYPDLIVHRLLKQRLAELGKPAGGFPSMTKQPPVRAELVQAAADSSFRERKAMEIERDVVDAYRAFFMRDRIGDKLRGTVTGVTTFGMFVAADEPFVEGLIRNGDLPFDDWQFDNESMRLTGRRTGLSFSLGDEVEVEVLNVSVATRRIDFRLVQGGQRGVAAANESGRARGDQRHAHRSGPPSAGGDRRDGRQRASKKREGARREADHSKGGHRAARAPETPAKATKPAPRPVGRFKLTTSASARAGRKPGGGKSGGGKGGKSGGGKGGRRR